MGELSGLGSHLRTARPGIPPEGSREKPQPSKQKGLHGKFIFLLRLCKQSGQTYRGQTHFVIENLILPDQKRGWGGCRGKSLLTWKIRICLILESAQRTAPPRGSDPDAQTGSVWGGARKAHLRGVCAFVSAPTWVSVSVCS